MDFHHFCGLPGGAIEDSTHISIQTCSVISKLTIRRHPWEQNVPKNGQTTGGGGWGQERRCQPRIIHKVPSSGLLGSLDTPWGEETSQLSLSDALEPLENIPHGCNSPQQKFEATGDSNHSEEDPNQTNPWTPGFLARIPRQGSFSNGLQNHRCVHVNSKYSDWHHLANKSEYLTLHTPERPLEQPECEIVSQPVISWGLNLNWLTYILLATFSQPTEWLILLISY